MSAGDLSVRGLDLFRWRVFRMEVQQDIVFDLDFFLGIEQLVLVRRDSAAEWPAIEAFIFRLVDHSLCVGYWRELGAATYLVANTDRRQVGRVYFPKSGWQ